MSREHGPKDFIDSVVQLATHLGYKVCNIGLSAPARQYVTDRVRGTLVEPDTNYFTVEISLWDMKEGEEVY